MSEENGKVRIRLLLFAMLREIVGADEKEIDLDVGVTAQDVWLRLRTDHPTLADYQHPPMTAVNMEYVPPETVLRDGDELAFIPPVSGG